MEAAIKEVPKMDPQRMHEAVRGMYSWHDVARRTEQGVYNKIHAQPRPSFLERLAACNQGGGTTQPIAHPNALDATLSLRLFSVSRHRRGVGWEALLRRDCFGHARLLPSDVAVASSHDRHCTGLCT